MKRENMIQYVKIWFFILMLMSINISLYATAKEDRTDSLLDVLEKRLLQKEQEALNFDRKSPGNSDRGDGEVSIKKYDRSTTAVAGGETTVGGASFTGSHLTELSRAIDELSLEVEQLSADVAKVKGDIQDDVGADHFVTIDAKIEDKDKFEIRNLSVKLDSFPVVDMDRSLGVWSPRGVINLFNGPLMPGKHELEFDIRTSLKMESDIPLEKNLYYTMKKTFNFEVTAEKSKKNIAILVKTPARDLDNEKLILQYE